MDIIISHNDLYEWLNKVLSKIDKKKITDSFLYSLSTRDLKYRAHLACYIYALSIPKHNILIEVYPSGNVACSYCRHCHTYPQNTDQIDWELGKWGGVRFQDVFTVTYYLDNFSRMEEVRPTKLDFDIFNNMIDTILLSDENAKPRDMEKKFGKIFKSNKGEREMLINQLGIVGILETDEYNGFNNKYTPPNLRAIPPVSKIDWHFPVCWWRGIYKINLENYHSLFEGYDELNHIIY